MSFFRFFDQFILIFSLVSMLYIPLKKHYRIDHLKDIIKIKYTNLYNDGFIGVNYAEFDIIVRYKSNIQKLDNSLGKYTSLYNAILVFLIILLAYSFMLTFVFPKYEIYDFTKSKLFFIYTNSIGLLISFIIWVMALPNILKINKLTKELDFNSIGLTSEIKSRILIIIIMMSSNILFITFKFFYYYYLKNDIDIKKERKPQKIQISNEQDFQLESTYKINKSEKSLKPKNETNRKLKNKDDIETEYEEDKKGEKDKEIKNQKCSFLKTENENFKNRINQLEEISKSKDEKILILEEDLQKLKSYCSTSKEKILKLEEDLQKFKSYFSTSEEELISLTINSVDQSIKNFNIVAKNSDLFTTLENKIYKEYPNLRESENYFLVNGIKINKNKSIKENKIKDKSVITLNEFDEK